MDLIFNLNSTPNWDFRWADQGSTQFPNWVATIENMIRSGQIVITSPDGYSVVESGGYTYIMGGVSAVPEPSSLVLACMATVGIAAATRSKSRRSGR
jgi:PEP-CTERM motif